MPQKKRGFHIFTRVADVHRVRKIGAGVRGELKRIERQMVDAGLMHDD